MEAYTILEEEIHHAQKATMGECCICSFWWYE